ncbi:hypothetical protein Tco_1111751 [Tanacetum coccineum]|uniref:Uncharacterized protein n=1 Tax=Tanacetum coccineum TaxID=301880 RepID=A0ABQ5IQC5_9ASTR
MGSGPIMMLDNVVSSSELSFMPNDDLHSMSAFDTVKSGDDVDIDMADSEHISKEGITDTFLNALAEFHSLSRHLDHVWEEVSNLHSRIADMESFILQSVSDKSRILCQLLLAMPYKISFLDSLLIHSKHVLTKVLKSEMGQSVTSKVHSGMQEVRSLNSQSKNLGKYCLNVQSMQTQLNVIQGLLESTVIIDDTAEGEKNKKDKDANLATTRGEHQLTDKIHSSGLIVKSQWEQPAELEVANKESTPPMEDDSDEDDLDKQSLSKRFKIMTLIPDIRNPIPLNSFVPEHFSPTPPREPTPPRDSAKGKEVTIVEEQGNELVPYQEEGCSIPRMPKIKSFITLEGTLSQEEFNNQIKEMKRLADLKAEKEKSEQELRKMFNQATLKAQA